MKIVTAMSRTNDIPRFVQIKEHVRWCVFALSNAPKFSKAYQSIFSSFLFVKTNRVHFAVVGSVIDEQTTSQRCNGES
jgi:hypothetical protein